MYAFTLIELLTVSALVATAVAIVTVRLDGFSEQGRLRAAARQLGALVRLCQINAMTAGRPVIIRYALDVTAVATLRPHVESDDIVWRERLGTELGSVRITAFTREGRTGNALEDHEHVDVRIGCDGRFDSHRIRLSLGGDRALDVDIDGVTAEVTIDAPTDDHEEDQQ